MLNKSTTTLVKPNEMNRYQRQRWIWWLFSVYYFIPSFYIPFDWLQHCLIIFAYIIFIALSASAFTSPATKVWQPLSGLLVLASATTLITSGTNSFFIYIGFFIGFYFVERQFFLWLIGTLIIIVALHFYKNYPVPFFLLPAILGIITVGMVGIIERIRHQAKIDEQQSHQEIRQLAMIAERERIARDLHDILGHTLSSVVLKAELADKLLQQHRTLEAREQMADLHNIARASLSLVRQTVSGYKHRGLSGEVITLVEKLRENGFAVNVSGVIPELKPQAETALILALTELTTNILRHSKGDQCTLTFTSNTDQLQVGVHDNGLVKQLIPGNGLQGIQERLHSLSGELQTNIQDGCQFLVTLPKHEMV